MAFNFSAASTDRVDYGDNAAWDGLAELSGAMHVNPVTLQNGDRLISKADGPNTGWQFGTQALTNRLRVGTGAANSVVDSTVAMTAGQDNTALFSWDGSNVAFLTNGSYDSPSALSRTMDANALDLSIGALDGGGSTSPAAAIEHVFLWNIALSEQELRSWEAGNIPRPSNLIFWQPCLSTSMVDLIQGGTATVTGSVGVTDGFAEKIPRYPSINKTIGLFGITQLLKILDETEEIVDGRVNILGLLKVLDEDLEISLTQSEFLGLFHVVNDVLQLEDGDGFNVNDPAGTIVDTLSDGTVWTRTYPPFIKRTRWV